MFVGWKCGSWKSVGWKSVGWKFRLEVCAQNLKVCRLEVYEF